MYPLTQSERRDASSDVVLEEARNLKLEGRKHFVADTTHSWAMRTTKYS